LKLLIDVNLSPTWASFLTEHSIEVVMWADIGNPKAEDVEIMQYARDHGFVIFTNDLDFGHLLAVTNHNAPSVIQIRTNMLIPKHVGKLLLEALVQFRSELESGSLITIEDQKLRARILPIQLRN
jgi:predicted nuclease of predicted toxin-antitoxin system